MATKSVKIETLQAIVGIPIEKLHLEANPARDSIIGPFGHNPTTIGKIKSGISEVGRVVEPIIVGPVGYRDEVYQNTPPDMYPVFNGNGRVLALREMKQENPTDQRFYLAPCIVQESIEKDAKKRTKETVLTNLAGHIRNEETSLGRALSYQQWMAVGLKTQQQIANLYSVAGAEVSNYLRLLRAPENMQTLLVEGETDSGLWSPAEKGERNGKKFSKLTASFLWTAVRRIASVYAERLGKKDVTDVEYHNALNAAYQHWEKSGVWDEAVIINYLNGMLARAGKEPVDGKPKAKAEPAPVTPAAAPTPATANAPTGNVTPGNGKDGGMGRANQSGDPKPVTSSQTVREAKEEQKPLDTSVKIDFVTRETSAMGWLANHLSQPGMPPQLATLGAFLKSAQWVQMTAGLTTMAPDHIKRFDMLIRETFVEPEATATTAATN